MLLYRFFVLSFHRPNNCYISSAKIPPTGRLRSSTAAGEGPPIRGLYQTKRGGLDLFFGEKKRVTVRGSVGEKTRKKHPMMFFGVGENLPTLESFCFEGLGRLVGQHVG